MEAWIRRKLNQYQEDFVEDHLKTNLGAWNHVSDDLQEKGDEILVKLLRVIPPHASVEKKVALLYWAISGMVTYDAQRMHNSKMPYSLWSALYEHKAVCMGLAELFSYMCYLLDIPAMTVAGYLDSRKDKEKPPQKNDKDHGYHAWNMVKLSDGRYYHLDLAGDLHTLDPDWKPSWFLKSDGQMYEHYWDPKRYPKADREYTEEIVISPEGVNGFCQHWQELIQDMAS